MRCVTQVPIQYKSVQRVRPVMYVRIAIRVSAVIRVRGVTQLRVLCEGGLHGREHTCLLHVSAVCKLSDLLLLMLLL